MDQYDISIDEHATNTSHAEILDLVGHNKRVLDVGCSSGYLAEVLGRHGCKVSGVEVDPTLAEQARAFADPVVVGDLEALDLVEELGEASFDVVMFGDVLEHTRDPLTVLRRSLGLLRPGGSVVISIPHIGHGDVRLALLKGRWDYSPLGLLDDTHLRFFTRDNLLELLRAAGLAATDIRRTTTPLGTTELKVDLSQYDQALIDEVMQDPEATTYQFVVRAVPDDAAHRVEHLAARELASHDRIVELERRVERLERENRSLLERAEAEAARATDEGLHAKRAHERVQEMQAEVESLHNTRTMRFLRIPRAIYARLRRLADG